MSAEGYTREIDKYLRLIEAGTDLTEAENRGQTKRSYRVSRDTGIACITWSPVKRHARSKIAVSEVLAVNKGKVAENFKHLDTVSADVCFSIVYTSESNEDTKTLALIAPTVDVSDAWVHGLNALLRSIDDKQMAAGVRRRWLEHIFDSADNNGDGTLDLKEIIKLAKELNMGFSKHDIQGMYKKAHKAGRTKDSLTFDEFVVLHEMMAQRPELNRIFEKYSSLKNKEWLSPAGLLHFIEVEQGIDYFTLDNCSDIISKYEPTNEGKSLGLMSIDGFRTFLLSSECDIFKGKHKAVCQDMTQPLSHYYIASSHNTYLTGNQLNGESSVEAYKAALLSGCRCVELDSWDGEHGEPIIYHGHTLTSKITFRDALKAIRDTAFVTSQYPVILSIENHCSIQQQDKMAEYFVEVLGDMLYADERDVNRKFLPSPEELKNKILIKNKKLDDETSGEDNHVDLFEEEQQAMSNMERKGSDSTGHSHAVEKGKKVKLSVKLSKCVNYIQSVQFTGFDTEGPCYHNSSFSEHSVTKHAAHNGVQFVRRNRTQLSRIYPLGSRVDSSNYDPIKAWSTGCQLVALNYQTSGKPMDLNMAMFQQNGGCGYVLKPEVMRKEMSSFDPNQKHGFVGVTPKTLSIYLFSGQNLPKPEGASKNSEIIDPYVDIQIVGIEADSSRAHSHIINDNGFNPSWDKRFDFVIKFPELAFLRFVVMDSDPGKDDFIGQYTMPFECIEPGYHHIHLTTTNGKPLPQASIFVYIEIQDQVSSQSHQLSYVVPEVGVPEIDSLLQSAVPDGIRAINICEDYLRALGAFKASCNVKPHSTFNEGVASFSKQIRSDTLLLESFAVYENDVYMLSPSNQAATPLNIKPMVDSFNNLNLAIKVVFGETDAIKAKLEDISQSAVNKKDCLNQHKERASSELKKQMHENYCAAVHTVRAVTKLLSETKRAAIDTAKKLLQAAEANGLDVKLSVI